MKTINLKDILSISGKSGLFRYVAQARNGIVVESLDDKKRFVAGVHEKVSSLEDIAIFTTGEEVPLGQVFLAISEKESGGSAIASKSGNEELKKYLLEVLPDYDPERVYVSDIRKLLSWYNILQEKSLLEVIEKEEETGVEEEKEA
ncbi:MAG: DUF5606 domain-containing protein [Bacteroidota bacterium]